MRPITRGRARRRAEPDAPPEPPFDWRYIGRELAIVFLGVLIALAVDNWTERRAERSRERDYLLRLTADLRRDSLFAQASILPTLARKDSALQRIAPVVRRQTDAIPDTLALLRDLALGGASGMGTLRIASRVTFEDMESTGNLRLIRDPSLRADIVEYYSQAAEAELRIDGRRSRYAISVHALIPAELRDRLTVESVRPFGVERVVRRVATDEFEDLLNQEINFSIFTRSSLEQFAERTNALLRRLRDASAG